MRRRATLLLVFALALMLAACAPVPAAAPADGGAADAGDGEVTLRYYGPWGGDPLEPGLVDECSAEAGVAVEYTEIAGGVAELMTELRALATANDMPDLFWMSSGFVDEFAADGLLYNIQPYVDESMGEDEFFTAAFASGRSPNKVDSDIYSLPMLFVETLLYYNIDAFDAAGLDYPTADWTWDDFLNAAQALTVDENGDGLMDQYGYYFYGRYTHIESWVYQNGGRFLNEERTRLEADEQALEALEFLHSLIAEHGVAPQPAEMDGVDNPFDAGIAAMWVDHSANASGLTGVNFDIAPVPAGPSNDGPTAYGWSDMISMSATTEHPDEAWALLRCLAVNRTAEMAASKVPVYRATALSEEWLMADQAPPHRNVILEWADHIGPTTFAPGWGEWRGYVGGAGLQGQLDEAFNGNQSVEEAVAKATEVANEVLGRYNPE